MTFTSILSDWITSCQPKSMDAPLIPQKMLCMLAFQWLLTHNLFIDDSNAYNGARGFSITGAINGIREAFPPLTLYQVQMYTAEMHPVETLRCYIVNTLGSLRNSTPRCRFYPNYNNTIKELQCLYLHCK